METIIFHPEKDTNAIAEAAAILRRGGLLGIPTETVYGLGADGLNEDAVRRIFEAKGRPQDNPLILHVPDAGWLERCCVDVPETAYALAEKFWPGPLTMIFKKTDMVPFETTGGLESVAVRMPDHPTALALIRAAGGYVAAPSANRSGRPSPTTAEHVAEDLGENIDLILDGGMVGIGIESTIVDFTEQIPTVLRPGYISLEMLQECIGEVKMDKGLLASDSKVRPKAPGMKYRHYAPKAPLSIVEGPEECVIDKINSLACEVIGSGDRVGIIATDETFERYPQGIVKSIGTRGEEETIAHNLYEVLREFDQLDVAAIYSEAFHTPKMGQAIMNRLLKAAGHTVITVL